MAPSGGVGITSPPSPPHHHAPLLHSHLSSSLPSFLPLAPLSLSGFLSSWLLFVCLVSLAYTCVACLCVSSSGCSAGVLFSGLFSLCPVFWFLVCLSCVFAFWFLVSWLCVLYVLCLVSVVCCMSVLWCLFYLCVLCVLVLCLLLIACYLLVCCPSVSCLLWVLYFLLAGWLFIVCACGVIFVGCCSSFCFCFVVLPRLFLRSGFVFLVFVLGWLGGVVCFGGGVPLFLRGAVFQGF